MSEGREEIPWSVIACILVLACFCAPSSELQIAESWYDKTALDDLLGVVSEKVTITGCIVPSMPFSLTKMKYVDIFSQDMVSFLVHLRLSLLRNYLHPL
jgi:hypothetical protein